ncbi:ATP-binding cassette domain-containing protein [Nonomuraea sp. NPDC049625]|uniref:ATP-binding cassette domain-containing protein n=1 Tax=Nonomuraea sp. NPDC049625 TaxID=3155775 RepID=UPI00342FE105
MSVKPGERVGIVGENGSGKSTLLRLLAGVERPDDGEVTLADDTGYLRQTLDLPPGHTVQQAVDAALAGLRAMERRIRELESALTDDVMAEYGELLTAYELRGGYEADARVDKAFHGLGLFHVGRDRPLSSLSGGERARLGLACVLAAAPRVLLLDEPTNHLDESALTWLEARLREHRGTVVVVSHDRVFLDRVATAVLEVEHGAITRFGDGYTGFLAAKAAARARWEQSYAAWCEEVRQVRDYAATTAHRVATGRQMRDNNKMAYDRNAGRVQSSVASRVRNAHERLRRLEADPVPRPPAPLRFHGTFTPTPTLPDLLNTTTPTFPDPLEIDETTPSTPTPGPAPNAAPEPTRGRRPGPRHACDAAPEPTPKRQPGTQRTPETTHEPTPSHAPAPGHAPTPSRASAPGHEPAPSRASAWGHAPAPIHEPATGRVAGERCAPDTGRELGLRHQRAGDEHAAGDEHVAGDEHAVGHGYAAGHGDAVGHDRAQARVLVELRDVRVGDRLHVPSLTVEAGDRLLVRGANGAGKSTLLQTLAEHARVRVGHLPQEVTFDPDLTVLDAYGHNHSYADERRAALLSTGLFKPQALDQKVGTLSVGQQRRLALARLLAQEYDLLLLDEPTNHLSPVLAEEIEQALDDYRGGLVVVSHDRALIRRFRGTEITLAGGRIC